MKLKSLLFQLNIGSAIFIPMQKFMRTILFLLPVVTTTFFLIFPDHCRLEISHCIFLVTAGIILLLEIRNFRSSLRFEYAGQVDSMIESSKAWLLFTGILLMQFGFLHEHIYGPYPAASSLYNGVFSHGGYMPYTDNAYFLIGIQAFLKYGHIVSMSLFRPEGMLWSAFICKLTGESVMLYFYFQAILTSVAIFASANILRRLFGWPWVLLFTWLLSGYAGLLQGTFLTELTSLPFALLSLALFIQGWTEQRSAPLFLGVAMLALAFEMRPAVFLFAPFVFILMGWSSGSTTRFKWKAVFISMAIYLSTVMCNRMVIGMLDHPPVAVSNTYGKLYQIYKGSDAWDEANNILPPKEIKDPSLVQLYKQKYVHDLVKKDPLPLVKNYLTRLQSQWKQPQKLFEVINPNMSAATSIILIWLILFGFIIHRGRRRLIVIHAFIICYLATAILSLPFLHAELRVMSVTQPIVVLTFIMALFNAYSIVIAMLHFMLSVSKIRDLGSFQYFGSDTTWHDRYQRFFQCFTFLPAILICLVMLTPLLLDRMRSSIPISLSAIQRSRSDTSVRLFLLDVRDAPRMHFDQIHSQVKLSPLEMPLDRILDKWLVDSSLQDGFYLFNAINHLNFEGRKSFTPHLVISDRVAMGIDMNNLDYLLLEVRSRETGKAPYPVRIIEATRIKDQIQLK